MRIGFHIPFSGNFKRLGERVRDSRGNTFQIFTRSLRGVDRDGKPVPLHPIKKNSFEHFSQFCDQKNIQPTIVHAPYSYNLAEESAGETIRSIIEDLEYCKQINAKYYVIQPGYYKKNNPFMAMQYIKQNLDYVCDQIEWDGIILVKNMAGAGTELGTLWQEYNELISFHEKIKGALDFSRVYSYGVDFRQSEADGFVQEFEEQIGWDKVDLCYINDCERALGSKKNQYVALGEGTISLTGYDHILSNKVVQEKIWMVENQPTIHHVDRSIAYLTSFYKEKNE
jgi:deoxyribonuclease-4